MSTICQELSRVLLVDDHPIVRVGLRALLKDEGFQVVGEASDGHEAIRLDEQLLPDVVVMDIAMPLLNGIDAGREILKAFPKRKIVALSMYAESHYVLACLRAGFVGYVLKSMAGSKLVEALHVARKGEVYLCPGVSRMVVDAYLAEEDARPDPLSDREREVLQLIAEGKNVKEIGDILGISTKTAESHRANVMHKLDIHELASLVRYAIRHYLVRPE